MGQTPHLVKEVVRKVKAHVEIPIFAKLTSTVPDIKTLAKSAVSCGADGITAINTVKSMAIDIETTKPFLGNKVGGLSGGAIKPIAVRCVYEITRYSMS